MNLLKCKECGGVVLLDGPLNCKCQNCGKKYERDYLEVYEEHTNFTSKYADNALLLFNSGNIADLSNLINAFTLQYVTVFCSKEELFYVGYEIENYLALFAAANIKDISEKFARFPTDSNYVATFKNAICNCLDVIYGVCKKCVDEISYEWIVGYLSNWLLGPITQAYRCASDRWNKYSHEEDSEGWNEYINVLDNCTDILGLLDVYGNYSLGSVYEAIIFYKNKTLTLTYPHKYWLLDCRYTQDIGLKPELKVERLKEIAEYQEKLDTFDRKKSDFEEKRKKEEEARLQAEKQARIDKFWAKNQDLKEQLLSEKEESLAKIENLKEKKDRINADKEINELKEEVQIATSALASLGFFAFKEKKAKKEQILQLNKEISQKRNDVTNAKAEVQKEIDSLNKRIEEIDNEFIIDRE